MNEQEDLAQTRDAIIERIKQVFPRKPRTKGKLRLIRSASERNNLKDIFEGKRWDEVIGHRSLIYAFTDSDYLYSLTDEAYQYYLPAFLVATLYDPPDSLRLPLERIQRTLSKYALEQVETLIEYLEYQIKIVHSDDVFSRPFRSYLLDIMETALLRVMIRRDELVKENNY